MNDEWQEVGAKTQPTPQREELDVSKVLEIPAPMEHPQFKKIVSELKMWHGELLKMERDGRLNNVTDNPTLLSEYLSKLRLNVNGLFTYWNNYIDALTDMQRALAMRRQELYEERLAMPKGTPSAAETHAKEMTRVADFNVKQIENRIQQIKNEYERYNGICMFLQSKMKENNTERIMQ